MQGYVAGAMFGSIAVISFVGYSLGLSDLVVTLGCAVPLVLAIRWCNADHAKWMKKQQEEYGE